MLIHQAKLFKKENHSSKTIIILLISISKLVQQNKFQLFLSSFIHSHIVDSCRIENRFTRAFISRKTPAFIQEFAFPPRTTWRLKVGLSQATLHKELKKKRKGEEQRAKQFYLTALLALRTPSSSSPSISPYLTLPFLSFRLLRCASSFRPSVRPSIRPSVHPPQSDVVLLRPIVRHDPPPKPHYTYHLRHAPLAPTSGIVPGKKRNGDQPQNRFS